MNRILILSLILFSTVTLNAQDTGILVISLPLDGTLNDTSGNDLNGVPTGYPGDTITYAPDRFEVPGKALALNGIDNYVTIGDGHSDFLDNSAAGDITIAFWVKYNSISGVTLNINKTDDIAGNQYSFHPDLNLNLPPPTPDIYYITFKYTYAYAADVNIYSVDPIDTTQWYFVCGTMKALPNDLTKCKLYVNGIYCDSLLVVGGGRPSPKTSVNIGRIPNQGTSNIGNFLMDALVIYDYAMNSTEIDSLYSSSSTATTITKQPMGFAAAIGSTAIFSIGASGQSPGYKWYKAPRQLFDPVLSTSPTFVKDNIQLSDSGNYFCVVYNVYGSINSDTVKLDVQTPVGINAVQKSEFAIFPNPTAGKICVSSVKNIQSIIIHNSFGAKIIEENAENQHFAFDLAQFGRGVYYISVKCDNCLINKKIIVL